MAFGYKLLASGFWLLAVGFWPLVVVVVVVVVGLSLLSGLKRQYPEANCQ